MKPITESELILNSDGSIYHLHLLPDDVADTVITVGDPDRVSRVSRHFDTIDLKKSKREFVTHTGTINGKRITVMSSGISTDNIDIVLNELDALVNIDLKTRLPKTQLRKLNIIRIGTSGAIQADIPVDSLLVSKAAFGLDTLMHYYKQNITKAEQQLLDTLKQALPSDSGFVPYIASVDKGLLAELGHGILQGITFTAPGFYAPQGREIRAHAAHRGFMNALQKLDLHGQRITNLEMETAGIYGLSAVLGHRAISFNIILANRSTQTFSKQPEKIVDNYIRQLLDRVADIL
ncbi:nucleoside phosphorylase [Mucilaginibacter sp. BT774]|uniref:nucleoside phosphorylase n=1 Tax=Mucilaginibacter sp. BT774 TaxID=3062276 RepID=UPI00267606DB|nr:nucleoside phosphorylase [Mucilaginibacter sp. BT774]MDO3624913.1 nucleoside phosphorylase [Mucilaginibacter sp. BT774]